MPRTIVGLSPRWCGALPFPAVAIETKFSFWCSLHPPLKGGASAFNAPIVRHNPWCDMTFWAGLSGKILAKPCRLRVASGDDGHNYSPIVLPRIWVPQARENTV